jgi:hypothetical protein
VSSHTVIEGSGGFCKYRHSCQVLRSFPRCDKKVKCGSTGKEMTPAFAATEAADTVILIVVVIGIFAAFDYGYYLKY